MGRHKNIIIISFQRNFDLYNNYYLWYNSMCNCNSVCFCYVVFTRFLKDFFHRSTVEKIKKEYASLVV